MNSRMPSPNRSKTGGTGDVSIVRNNLVALRELKVTLTTDSNGAITNAIIMPGPVGTYLASKFSLTAPDHTHYTLGSSVSAANSTGYGEYKEYLKAGLHVDYIRIQTTNTDVYNGSLFIAEMPANGIASPQEIVLAPYATVVGGGGSYDKTLTITDRDFAITRIFSMWITNLPASTTVTVAFGIDGMGDSITVG